MNALSHPQLRLHGTPSRAQALAGYGRVSLEAKVETASPHELVQMLFRKLINLLREAHEGAVSGNSVRRLRATERALSIIEGLDATLDREKGGSVADSLHQVYDLLRNRLLSGTEDEIKDALNSAEAIAHAWAQITKQPPSAWMTTS